MDPDALQAAEFDFAGQSVASNASTKLWYRLAADGTKWMTGIGPDLDRVLSASTGRDSLLVPVMVCARPITGTCVLVVARSLEQKAEVLDALIMRRHGEELDEEAMTVLNHATRPRVVSVIRSHPDLHGLRLARARQRPDGVLVRQASEVCHLRCAGLDCLAAGAVQPAAAHRSAVS